MPPTRRLVRQRPLLERITARLDPRDMLLWLSEEIETREWNASKTLGTQLGIGMSIIFMLARANSGGSDDDDDDLFSDDEGGSWMPWLARPIVWLLALLSVWNAFYTLTRVRNYRLFEVDIDAHPETPSVRRVQVQSEPASSSPLRFIGNIMATESAESRAHADKTRDVWELSVWDPLPVCLRLFCIFSPGHVFAYWIFLPLQSLDPYPSLTILKAVLLQVTISWQLYFLQSKFSQQIKDSAIIHKEVLHEYDTKFVHPRMHPVVRDAGTQVYTTTQDGEDESTLYSEHGTPTTLIKRGFQTHPNPNYSKHIDPNGAYPNVMSPRLFTPSAAPQKPEIYPPSRIRSSAQRQSLPPQSPPVPAHAARLAANGSTNFGGSMGVYTHANSPLKKATSMGDMNTEFVGSPRNSREMAAREQLRQGSPSKGENRRLTTSNVVGFGAPTTDPFANIRNRHSTERYPTRWS